MTPPKLTTYSLDCQPWFDELKLMVAGSYTAVSATLLVPGCPVRTYKSSGFLFDANCCTLQHISDRDSGSSGGGGGSEGFYAFGAGLSDLPTLAARVRSGTARPMNEVNAHFRPDGLRGIFVVRDAKFAKLGAIEAGMFCRAMGIDLPLFQYSPDGDGGMDNWQPTQLEVDSLLDVLPEKMRLLHGAYLASLRGLTTPGSTSDAVETILREGEVLLAVNPLKGHRTGVERTDSIAPTRTTRHDILL